MADSKSEEKKTEQNSISDELDAQICSGKQTDGKEGCDQKPVKSVAWADHIVDFIWQPSCELTQRQLAVQQFLCLVIDPNGKVWDRSKLRSMSQDAITFFSTWEGRK